MITEILREEKMPNASSKPGDSTSKIQRIEIQIRDIHPGYIKELLINFFHFKDSPTSPVYVKFDRDGSKISRHIGVENG
jgi:hypothetical protein